MDEFVKRDLNNIESLNNLQWRIKGQKLTKEKVIEYLSSNEAKNLLNKKEIRKLFEDFELKKDKQVIITDTDDLLYYLSQNDDWFNLIFK